MISRARTVTSLPYFSSRAMRATCRRCRLNGHPAGVQATNIKEGAHVGEARAIGARRVKDAFGEHLGNVDEEGVEVLAQAGELQDLQNDDHLGLGKQKQDAKNLFGHKREKDVDAFDCDVHGAERHTIRIYNYERLIGRQKE